MIQDQAQEVSSKGEKSFIEEDLPHSVDIMGESSVLDGEVGKRLNQMVPVPVSITPGNSHNLHTKMK